MPLNIGYERDPEKHAQKTRLLAPGFRLQSLRDQEHIIHKHADLMINQLQRWDKESNGKGVDMVQVFQWLTFDVIGSYSHLNPIRQNVYVQDWRFSLTLVRRMSTRPASLW